MTTKKITLKDLSREELADFATKIRKLIRPKLVYDEVKCLPRGFQIGDNKHYTRKDIEKLVKQDFFGFSKVPVSLEDYLTYNSIIWGAYADVDRLVEEIDTDYLVYAEDVQAAINEIGDEELRLCAQAVYDYFGDFDEVKWNHQEQFAWLNICPERLSY